MYNWSVDTKRLQKNTEQYERYVLEQRINFGLNGKKLSRSALIKHWDKLNIDTKKRMFLQNVLWPSLPNNSKMY